MHCLCLCNNVSPVVDKGERTLQASSPDEVALVNFVEKLGYMLLERRTNIIKIKTPSEIIEEYEILYNFPFDSARKRMGIILKNRTTNEIIFYLKGADVIMKQFISDTEKVFVDEEGENLSKEGLRTLVLGYKNLTEKEYEDFEKNYQSAG